MAELDHGQFFALSEEFRQGALRVRPARRLRASQKLARAEVVRRRPVAFEHDEGTRPYDLIGATLAVLYLVSDRLIAALEGVTGWTTYPVALRGRRGEPLPGYGGLAVTGRAGPIDDALSPQRMLPPPTPDGNEVPGRVGLLFQPDSWDASDVFVPGESTIVMVTERVRDALVAANVTNVALDRITQIERIWDAQS